MITIVAHCQNRTITLPIPGGSKEVTCGSIPGNTLYLPYKGISRRHFVLKKKDNEWLLQDFQSTNGTYVNGEKVSECLLKSGDTIRAGTVVIDFTSEERPSVPIAFPVSSSDSGTQEVSSSDQSASSIFSFPRFKLPEGFILGKSAAMNAVYEKIHSILDSDVNVLFIGETGTGKEMFAKLLHASGDHSSGPFIAVNCAAIPADLMEAELFGIGEKVATNVSQRKGKIVAADGGTLFLDELAAFPFPLQAKILRALEERVISPVGENRSIPVDFRLLSATNEDPQELIGTKRLREDLYHRVATVEIRLPALTERKKDLPDLIVALVAQISERENKNIPGISKTLLQTMQQYSYPGNVRELVNIVRAMVALAHPGEILDIQLLPEKLLQEHAVVGDDLFKSEPFDLQNAVDTVTRKLVLQTLQFHDWNIRKAAEHLKLSPFGLRKMMKRLNIEKL